MDIGASPPLTCCSLSIYLSPSSTGLFSSSFSEDQGTKRGHGLWTNPPVLHPVTRSPGHGGWSCFTSPLPLELMQMETQGFLVRVWPPYPLPAL